MNDCTCQLAPGLYRVASDGSTHLVAKVVSNELSRTSILGLTALICVSLFMTYKAIQSIRRAKKLP
jgi:hypothetical protein